MSPDLNTIERILKWKVEKHHVSNIQQLHDVIVEKWKGMPATTCAALVKSMLRKIKAVLENNGALTKTLLTCSLRVYSFLLPVIWTSNRLSVPGSLKLCFLPGICEGK